MRCNAVRLRLKPSRRTLPTRRASTAIAPRGLKLAPGLLLRRLCFEALERMARTADRFPGAARHRHCRLRNFSNLALFNKPSGVSCMETLDLKRARLRLELQEAYGAWLHI